jgi:hypothetical protein
MNGNIHSEDFHSRLAESERSMNVGSYEEWNELVQRARGRWGYPAIGLYCLFFLVIGGIPLAKSLLSSGRFAYQDYFFILGILLLFIDSVGHHINMEKRIASITQIMERRGLFRRPSAEELSASK